jgi:hypothetical protein
VFFWSHTKLIVEGVMPDLLHIVPVGHDTMLDRVLQRQNTTLRLSLISDIRILLVHTNHDSWVFWSTNNGWKHGTRSIITGETSFAHSRSIIYKGMKGTKLITD